MTIEEIKYEFSGQLLKCALGDEAKSLCASIGNGCAQLTQFGALSGQLTVCCCNSTDNCNAQDPRHIEQDVTTTTSQLASTTPTIPTRIAETTTTPKPTTTTTTTTTQTATTETPSITVTHRLQTESVHSAEPEPENNGVVAEPEPKSEPKVTQVDNNTVKQRAKPEPTHDEQSVAESEPKADANAEFQASGKNIFNLPIGGSATTVTINWSTIATSLALLFGSIVLFTCY
jgi:hypothetical protein